MACDKREAFAHGSKATQQSIFAQMAKWIVLFLTVQSIPRLKKESDVRVRKRTEASTTVSHIWSDAARSRSVSGPRHDGEFFR